MVNISIEEDGAIRIDIAKAVGETTYNWSIVVVSTSEKGGSSPIIIDDDDVAIP